MRVSGLQSLYGNYYGTSRISTLRNSQLQQIMQGIEQASSTSSTSSAAYAKRTTVRSMAKANTEFLKNYNQSMSDLMTSANRLRAGNSTSVWNQTTVQSSDKSVLSATQNYRMNTKDSYAVNVKQLATKQSNLSMGIQKNAAAEKDAAFSIQTKKGTYAFAVSAQDKDGNAKTNGQLLRDIADAVNEKDIGVQATVSRDKDDTEKITFTSKETGEKNAFTVTGEAAAAYGFDQVQQAAQDAAYTVSKNGRKEESFTSAENTVSMDYGRLDVTFQQTGAAEIKAGQVDQERVISAVKDLVEKNNSTISMLEESAEKGYGVQSQLNEMKGSSFANRYLENIGITRGTDGRLALDETKLTQALEENAAQTKDAIAGSFGLAQSAFDDARAGMSQSGSTLLTQNSFSNFADSSYGSYSNEYSYFSDFTNSLQMLGLYNRYGVQTMSNVFALGKFFDQYF